MQKKNKIRENFSRPLSDIKKKKKKNQGPLFGMKIMDQPHRKACELNFH